MKEIVSKHIAIQTRNIVPKLKDTCNLHPLVYSDEILFDDFFFTNCKCPLCIEAKGDKSWTQFRLEQITRPAENWYLHLPGKLTPNVKVIIKYPELVRTFSGTGIQPERSASYIDGIYTGTETRDPVISNQHLQRYESYLIFRYFENIKTRWQHGRWVNPSGSRLSGSLRRTAMADDVFKSSWIHIVWLAIHCRCLSGKNTVPMAGSGYQFRFWCCHRKVRQADGSLPADTNMTLAAGAALELVDQFLEHTRQSYWH